MMLSSDELGEVPTAVLNHTLSRKSEIVFDLAPVGFSSLDCAVSGPLGRSCEKTSSGYQEKCEGQILVL